MLKSCLIVLTACLLNGAGQARADCNFNRGFEIGGLDDILTWTAIGVSSNIIGPGFDLSIEPDPYGQTGPGLRAQHDGSGTNILEIEVGAQAGARVLSFDIRPYITPGASHSVTVYLSEGSAQVSETGSANFGVQFTASGSIAARASSVVAVGSFVSNEWYHVELSFETTDDTFSLSVTGPGLAGPAGGSNFSFSQPLTAVHRMTVLADGPGAHEFALDNIAVCDPCTGGIVSGLVTDSGVPLAGVTVDLFGSDDQLLALAVTGPDGSYAMPLQLSGEYSVSVVEPIGYLQEAPVPVVLCRDQSVDFQLKPIPIVADARSPGYWKHQVKSLLSGHGNAQEGAAIEGYLTAIFDRFYSGPGGYEVRIAGVTHTGNAPLSLAGMSATLESGSGSSAASKARRQFLALLLNVVSGKLASFSVVTEDGRTISQVIQQFSGSMATNPGFVHTNGELLNSGHMLPAGRIATMPQVPYEHADPVSGNPDPRRLIVGPTPSRTTATFQFTLPRDRDVRVNVVDAQGRLIWQSERRSYAAGEHRIDWDGHTRHGQPAESGIYFVTLDDGNTIRSARLVRISH